MDWNHSHQTNRSIYAPNLIPSVRLRLFTCGGMMTSSNGNIFRVTDHLCGKFTGPGEFPAQRPVTRSFDVFFDLRLNKRLSKQPWGWWFETPAWSLWRHRNGSNNAQWISMNEMAARFSGGYAARFSVKVTGNWEFRFIAGIMTGLLKRCLWSTIGLGANTYIFSSKARVLTSSFALSPR